MTFHNSSKNVSLGFLSVIPFLLLPALLTLFPDERIVRLKLQGLEYLAFFWFLGFGCWHIMTMSWPEHRRFMSCETAVMLWGMVMIGLWVGAVEKSLATMELRRVIVAMGLFFCARGVSLSTNERMWVYRNWMLFAVLISIYAFLQRTGGVGFIDVPQMDRPMGTFGNPIFLAAFLVASIWIIMAGFIASQKRFEKAIFLLALGCLVVALGLTQTRAAILALVGSLFLFVVVLSKKMSWRLSWAMIVLIVVVGWSTRSLWVRDQAHLLIWRDTVRLWFSHPLLGVGLGAFHINFPQFAQADLTSKWPQGQFIVNYAHNEYLQTLAETGIVGFSSFMVVIILFLRAAYQTLSSTAFGDKLLAHPKISRERFCVVLAATALLIQNSFSVDMRFSISFALFFFLMGFAHEESFKEGDDKKKVVHIKVSPMLPLWARGSLLAVFGGGMLGLVFPKMAHPYRAQAAVRVQPDFFDERLLDPAKTVWELESLTKQYPSQAIVWERLGYAYAKEMKTPDGKINLERAQQAIAAYKKVIEIDPAHVSAMNNLGNIYFTMGQVHGAIDTWDKAVRLRPDFLALRLNLGKVLYTQGRLKESAAHLEEVLRLDPGNAEAIVYLKKMVE